MDWDDYVNSDPILTEISADFLRQRVDEIDRVWYDLFMRQPLPVVRRQSDNYYEFKQEDWGK